MSPQFLTAFLLLVNKCEMVGPRGRAAYFAKDYRAPADDSLEYAVFSDEPSTRSAVVHLMRLCWDAQPEQCVVKHTDGIVYLLAPGVSIALFPAARRQVMYLAWAYAETGQNNGWEKAEDALNAMKQVR